jgi:predicted anti-sigma-YlaC factor YlaD
VDAHPAHPPGNLAPRRAETAVTCREFAEFVSDYLAGDLAPDLAETFRKHLDCCPDCVNYLETFKRTVQAAQWAKSPEAPLPPDVPERLIQAIRASRG